jgi:hypothetical protein
MFGLFVWLIRHQPAVLFSQNKPAISNQLAVLFSQNKSAPAISHQPNEQTGFERGGWTAGAISLKLKVFLQKVSYSLDLGHPSTQSDGRGWPVTWPRWLALLLTRNRKEEKRHLLDLDGSGTCMLIDTFM